MKRFFFFLFVSSLIGISDFSKTQIEIFSSEKTLKKQESITIGIKMSHPEGWHSYHPDSDEFTQPLEIDWEIPSWIKASKIQRPVPEKFISHSQGKKMVTYGYSGTHYYFISLTPQKGNLSDRDISIKGNLSWQICNAEETACIPEEYSFALSYPLQDWDKNSWEEIKAFQSSQKFPPLSQPSFLPHLFFAFLGGIILNCMPCVFPIISLKILDFSSQAGESRKKLFLHGFSFSMGILLSMWVLASLLIFFNKIGTELGWGFQLQSPAFLAFIITLLFIISLNLFGLFEFGISLTNLSNQKTRSKGLKSSFFSGLLTTLIATPCSGPFLGSTIGFALQQTSFILLLIFTFFALGIAFPYLLLCSFPRWLKKLPAPGAWMNTLKQFLAFPMLASVIFFFYSYSSLVDNRDIFLILWGFLLLAFSLWIYGKYSLPSQKKKIRFFGIGCSLFFFFFSIFLIFQSTKEIKNPLFFQEETSSKWEEWTPEKLDFYQKEKRIIYVDFTADWCLTCQFNKKRVFSSSKSAKVWETLEKYNVVLLKADWTQKNPVITRFLKEKLNRGSVPVNIIYSPYKKTPLILPEILSAKIVIESIEKMANVKN